MQNQTVQRLTNLTMKIGIDPDSDEGSSEFSIVVYIIHLYTTIIKFRLHGHAEFGE